MNRLSKEEAVVFLDTARRELKGKQLGLRDVYGFGSFAGWKYEQATSRMAFYGQGGHLVLTASVLVIGTLSRQAKTWQWGWANDAFLPALKESSTVLKQLAAITGNEVFSRDDDFHVDNESAAWDLAAMAVKFLDALGLYTAPPATGTAPVLFFAITHISVANRQ